MRSLSTPGGRWFLLAVLLTGVLLGLSACGGSKSEDQVTTLAADDPSLDAAREQAQSKWPEFVASFKAKPELAHSVKVAFPAADGSTELVWVSVESITGDDIEGTLDSDPVGDLGVEYGDQISVKEDQVDDWVVYDDGKVVLGGFSISDDGAAGTTTTTG